MEPTGGKPGKTACSPCCGEEPPERIGRREPGQSSPSCEEFLLPGATSPPGTIKTIGFRLPTCRASNFPRTAGRNSTHRPQVRHDGSLPRTVEGETLAQDCRKRNQWPSPCCGGGNAPQPYGMAFPNEKPLCDFHTGALERPPSPQNGERPREPLEKGFPLFFKA